MLKTDKDKGSNYNQEQVIHVALTPSRQAGYTFRRHSARDMEEALSHWHGKSLRRTCHEDAGW